MHVHTHVCEQMPVYACQCVGKEMDTDMSLILLDHLFEYMKHPELECPQVGAHQKTVCADR